MKEHIRRNTLWIALITVAIPSAVVLTWLVRMGAMSPDAAMVGFCLGLAGGAALRGWWS